jgi:hypothetical protein
MWGTKTLERAKRRLLGDPDEPGEEAVSEVVADVGDVDQVGDLALSLVRPELDRFVSALATSLDPFMPRPDSPARLAGALGTAIDRIGGRGRPTVTRSPAGLYTPEYWHVRVEGADQATRRAIERLTAGGRVG